MGYTHYWYTADMRDKEKFIEAVDIIHSTIKKGMDAGDVEDTHFIREDEDFIKISGYKESCEEFWLQYSDANGAHDKGKYNLKNDFNFCKTRMLPYDTAVVAALCILAHFFPDADISSDGDADDWAEGYQLAWNHSGIKGLALPKRLRPE